MPVSLHAALRHEAVAKADANGVKFALVRLRSGKTDSRLTIHAKPSIYSMSGLQTTDSLAHLGFRRGSCSFLDGECYASEVSDGFALDAFVEAFHAFDASLKKAEDSLSPCGLHIPQSEGIGFFIGTRSDGQFGSLRVSHSTDGHTAGRSEKLKQSEDDLFKYALSWIESERARGWTIHYRPAHGELSSEVEGALALLGDLVRFDECPVFDFEPCRWRFEPIEQTSSIRGTNVEFVNREFDAHPEKFASGVRSILQAHRLMTPFGFRLLGTAADSLADARQSAPVGRDSYPTTPAGGEATPALRDVFLCHASEDKADVVQPLVDSLTRAGISYWYDKAEIAWGDSLTEKINAGLRTSRFVVVVLSAAFVGKNWPKRELHAALSDEASSGELKVLPLLCGSPAARDELMAEFPLLRDKLHVVWDGEPHHVVEKLQRRLSLQD